MLAISLFLDQYVSTGKKIQLYIEVICNLIPKLIYLQVTLLLQLIDIFQLMFKKLAGLDVFYVEGNPNPQSGDILGVFLRKVIVEKGALNTAFWGIAIIGLFLLFLSTFVAVLRSQYMSSSEDKKIESPTKPIAQAIKGLISFVIVPCTCLFGVYISNFILIAIDKATSVEDSSIFSASDRDKLQTYTLSDGKTTYMGYDLADGYGSRTQTFSGIVFKAAAYNANRFRTDDEFKAMVSQPDVQAETGTDTEGGVVTFGTLFKVNGGNYEASAKKVDEAFAFCYKLNSSYQKKLDVSKNPATSAYGYGVVSHLNFDWTNIEYKQNVARFSKFRVGYVWYYYNLWKFDFIIGIGAVVVMLIVFLNLIMALIKRIIDLTILTIISPGIIGIMPIDNGDALKKWRVEYVKKTISAYGAVAAMNLLFLILPVFNKIKFFNVTFVDYIINTFIVIVGLSAVKDFMKMISDLIGGEDAQEVGGKMKENVQNTALKVGAVGAGMAGAALKASSVLPRVSNKAVGAIRKKVYNDKHGTDYSSYSQIRDHKKNTRYQRNHRSETAGMNESQVREMRHQRNARLKNNAKIVTSPIFDPLKSVANTATSAFGISLSDKKASDGKFSGKNIWKGPNSWLAGGTAKARSEELGAAERANSEHQKNLETSMKTLNETMSTLPTAIKDAVKGSRP